MRVLRVFESDLSEFWERSGEDIAQICDFPDIDRDH